MSAGNIGGLIAIALTPGLIAYAQSYALRHYGDGKHFRVTPIIWGFYFSGLITFGFITFYFPFVLVTGKEQSYPTDWLAVIVGLFFLGTTIWSWPATIVLNDNGLSWRRKFRLRRFYP